MLPGRSVLRAPGDVGEERVSDVEHDQADAAAPAVPQLPRRVIAHEAEFRDSGLYPGDGIGRNLFGAVHHVGYCADRDSGFSRNVPHTNRCHRTPFVDSFSQFMELAGPK